MTSKTILCLAALSLINGCQNPSTTAPKKTNQSAADITSCVRTVLKLDEGTWAYMGTIARGNGKFRTFATTSEHASAGTDTWSFRSYGGDMGGDYSGEISYSKLVGTSLIPLEDNKLMEDDAIKYTSCTGPDAEGRYQVSTEYRLPHMDERFLAVKNIGWFSEHGSYYAEDIFDDTGRILSRRSGVNTPVSQE